jgi:hypothetical protein
MTTARGTVMNGVIDLGSKATSSYVSAKSDDWTKKTWPTIIRLWRMSTSC